MCSCEGSRGKSTPCLLQLLEALISLPHGCTTLISPSVLSLPFLPLTLLPRSYKDACGDIEPTWMSEDNLPISRPLLESHLPRSFCREGACPWVPGIGIFETIIQPVVTQTLKHRMPIYMFLVVPFPSAK